MRIFYNIHSKNLTRGMDSLQVKKHFKTKRMMDGFIVSRHAYQNASLFVVEIDMKQPQQIEFARLIKVNFPSVPLLVVTDALVNMFRLKFAEFQVNAVLEKPVSIKKFKKTVVDLIIEFDLLPAIEYGVLMIDQLNRRVTIEEKEVNLTKKEYEILVVLAKNINCKCSKDEIFFDVWDTDFRGETRTLDMHIKGLRQKINQSTNLLHISTVRGIGYQLSHS